jgi:phosphomevalonate kinase
MAVEARAPGKLVLLGEYAVLDGAHALVMAVDRHAVARIGPWQGPHCRIETRMPDAATVEFAPGQPSGLGLVDLVVAAGPRPRWPVWAAELDSAAFFAGSRKLGLGSSAAALVAFAGAWARAASPAGPAPALTDLVELHRRFQGGAGSGIDIAAAWAGGVIEFWLDDKSLPRFGSVQLPKSVGFAGIFAGSSASTPDLVGRYRRWVDARPDESGRMRRQMGAIAGEGCAAAGEDDGAGLVAAIAAYGRCLDALGDAIGAEILTPAHREIAQMAEGFGLAYKVSGAGGGDVGIACGLDAGALGTFSATARRKGFHVVDLGIDDRGLFIEEPAE